MIIYKLLNKINGKCYIGQTIQKLNHRISVHICGKDDNPIQRAIKKYGIQSFECSVIDNADLKDILNEKEIYWINFLKTKVPNGYNVTNGGDGRTGKLSEETKIKISQSLKGRHLSEKTKRKISETNKGKPAGTFNSKGFLGKHHSDEWKRKIGDARKGGNNVSKRIEVREKLSRSAKARWNKNPGMATP